MVYPNPESYAIWSRYDMFPEMHEWLPRFVIEAYANEASQITSNFNGGEWLGLEYSKTHHFLSEVLSAKILLERKMIQDIRTILEQRDVDNYSILLEVFSGRSPISRGLLGTANLAFHAVDIDPANALSIPEPIHFDNRNILIDGIGMPDISADFIVDLNGIYTVTIGAMNISDAQVGARYERVLKEYFRVLKPGGRIFVSGPFNSKYLHSNLLGLIGFLNKELSARKKLGKRELPSLSEAFDILRVLKENRDLTSGCRFISDEQFIEFMIQNGLYPVSKVTGGYYGANSTIQAIKNEDWL